MFGHKLARVILASTAIAGTCWALPAAAQSGAVPDRTSVDANGVDLFLGRINFNSPVLSAGQDDRTGLAYQRISNGGADNIWASIYVSGAQTTIAFKGDGNTFTLSGGVYTPLDADGSTLTLASGIYTYTGRDGSVMHSTLPSKAPTPTRPRSGWSPT